MRNQPRPFLLDIIITVTISVSSAALVAAIARRESVNIASVLALVGWFVTGIGWYVSWGAQRRMFVHQIKNAARSEIVAALRKEQGIVGSVRNLIFGIDPSFQRSGQGREVDWSKVFPKYRELVAERDENWLFTLEQYELLFPETAACRRQLVRRTMDLNSDVIFFLVALMEPHTRGPALDGHGASRFFDRLGDQAALLEDLLVYIQNATIGEIVGREVPFRKPLDPKVPRIVVRDDGQLELVEPIKITDNTPDKDGESDA